MSLNYFDYPVLYVDDEPANVSNLSYALEDHFTVLTATHADDALRLLAERDVAVLLADFKMPDMDGAELCAQARTVRPDAVRIIVTAYPELHTVMTAINRGQVSRFIAKPFDDAELIQTLRDAIDLAHLQRSLRTLELRVLRSTEGGRRAPGQELARELGRKLTLLAASFRDAADATEAALRLPGASDQARELLASAEVSHRSAFQLLEQLGEVAERLARGDVARSSPEPRCEVARAVAAAVRTLRPDLEKRGRVQVQIDHEPVIAMEPGAFGQVLTHLLANAGDALGTIGAGMARITVQVAGTGGEAVVRVSDSGSAIPREALERVFDPYFSPHGKNGLGLAIAHDLVAGAGGRIEVESVAGKGSTFTVRIPTRHP